MRIFSVMGNSPSPHLAAATLGRRLAAAGVAAILGITAGGVGNPAADLGFFELHMPRLAHWRSRKPSATSPRHRCAKQHAPGLR